MMDFGYPQFTEANILSEFIKTDAYRMEVSHRPPMAVTNAVSWRSEGIHYKNNEVASVIVLLLATVVVGHLYYRQENFKIIDLFQVFLDVVESVNVLVNNNGQVIRSDIFGALKMRTNLR